MGNRTARREEALHSALDRLNVPIMICDEEQILQPLNGRATALFEAENLRGDLLTARPSHPLSRLIDEILRTDAGEVRRRMVTFPSGKRYAVESSGRSRKGLQRWLVLLLEPLRESSLDEQSALERWPLLFPPPATSTLPFGSKVAVCWSLAVAIEPSTVQAPVAGSKRSEPARISALAVVAPPATSTVPSESRVAV